jgi:hypothetical protein
MIIRPPRADYDEASLPKSLDLDGKTYKYESFDIKNSKDEKLSCTMFEPSTD